MNTRPTRETDAGRLYLALRKKARAEGRRTDELRISLDREQLDRTIVNGRIAVVNT